MAVQPNLYSCAIAVNSNTTGTSVVTFGFDVAALRIDSLTCAASTGAIYVALGSTAVSTGHGFLNGAGVFQLTNLPRINVMSLTTTSTAGVIVSVIAVGG